MGPVNSFLGLREEIFTGKSERQLNRQAGTGGELLKLFPFEAPNPAANVLASTPMTLVPLCDKVSHFNA